MSDEMRDEAGVTATDAVSSNPYDPIILEYIDSHPDDLILDAGSGLRPTYYSNVVNFEIAPYDTTDVLGVGEHLPFKDNSFDFVISVAVLEHVRNPAKCASELYRVLRPGGEMFVAVPFLQPYHGYPHHYYNMTKPGLRNLFPASLQEIEHYVPHYFKPLWVAEWFFRVWASGLSGDVKEQFLDMSVRDFLAAATSDYDKPFVADLDDFHNLTLASGTVLRAKKPE
jgi:SAM-dependent methyltransferase